MVVNRSSVFLEVIEDLSKSPFISNGEVHEICKEILKKGAHFLKIPRVNAWILNEEESSLENLLSYRKEDDCFYQEVPLYAEVFPRYFDHVQNQQIIISSNAQTDMHTIELLESYLIPNRIHSMMEIPIISGGKFRGIICFETNTKNQEWSNDAQHFAVALTQLLTLTLEIEKKMSYREQLEKLISEKTSLIDEMNHRVKNNISVLTALIKRESEKSKDHYHRDLFNNILSKTFTLSAIQETTYRENHLVLNLCSLTREIARDISNAYGLSQHIDLEFSLEEGVFVSDIKAIPVALLLNDIITQVYNYLLEDGNHNRLFIKLFSIETSLFCLEIHLYGAIKLTDAFLSSEKFELAMELAVQIDGEITIKNESGGSTIILLA
jgi:two-component sensor histidine kinase